MSPLPIDVNAKTILHICAREMLRPLRDQILRLSGFGVDSALSMEQGLSLYWANSYDLVLIDVEGEYKVLEAEQMCSEIKTAQPHQLVAFVCNWRVAIMTDCPDEILRTEFDPARFVSGVKACCAQPEICVYDPGIQGTMTAKKSTQQAKSPVKKAPGKAARKSAAKSRKPEDKYTDPALREHIKEEVTAGDKGGNPGQWSARKAQLVAHEYQAQGGGYKGGQDESQHSLKSWGDEHWTTRDGEPAKQADGMHRYLPEQAWQELSPAEKASTDKKKLQGSASGEQFVPNTTAAKSARKRAEKP